VQAGHAVDQHRVDDPSTGEHDRAAKGHAEQHEQRDDRQHGERKRGELCRHQPQAVQHHRARDQPPEGALSVAGALGGERLPCQPSRR
jgi:hypothetical protein